MMHSDFVSIVDSGAGSIDNDYHIISSRYNPSNATGNSMNLDGSNIGTPNNNVHGHGAAKTSIGGIGANFYLNGQIAEALIYNGALTDAEIGCVEAYLADRWALNATANCTADAATSTVAITINNAHCQW